MTSLYLLDKTETVIKIIPQSDMLELWQNDGINKLDTIEGSIKLTKENKEFINDTTYFALQDADDDYSFHIYRAITKTINNSEINIYGIQKAFDDLKVNGYVKDLRPDNRQFEVLLGELLNNSGWEVGFVDDRLPTVTNNFYYQSTLDALSDLVSLTGVEFDFRVAISGNEITGKYVDAHYQIGSDNGKRFVYGTNSVEIVAEEDNAELYTAFLGRGRGEQVSSAEENTGGQAGYGRKITFEDVEWKKSNGDPVDKPLGQEYVEIVEATNLYSADGNPRLAIREYNTDDKEELLRLTYEDLLNYARPQVQFKTTVGLVGDMHKGDIVSIIRHDLDIKYQSRVFEIKRNRMNNNQTEIQIGDKILKSEAEKQAEFENTIEDRISETETTIENVWNIASDGTKITYGPNEPETKKPNDVWYEEMPDGKTNLRRWDGENWIIVVSDVFGEEIANQIEEQQAEIDETKKVADDAVNEINTAVENAGFTSLDDTIENIDSIASGVKSELDVAIENAGFTSLDDTLQNMTGITSNAEQNAQQAITDASNAYGLAQTSISEAQTAQENSLTALGKADNALGGVSNLDIRVDDVEAELELKADNTFMTEDGELTTLSNAITFNAHRFSSDMSRIESRVESLAGEINLVILRDAFEETRVIGGEVYPNPTPHSNSDTMREMISVTPGEKLAISKESSPSGYDWFTINYYDENDVYIDSLLTSSNQQVITIPPEVYKMWVAYPVESKPQITRGTDFLPYRPNIADQMTADEVTVFRNEYDEFADKTERRLTAIDSSGGRLDTAELLITQTANGLDLKADQTTVNELTGEVENLGTEFDIVAGQVSSKVWNTDIETAIDGIEVGGRNLLKNTATFDYPWDSGHYMGMDDPLGENNAVKLNPDRPYLGYLVSRANMSKFEPGQYVLSFWAKGDSTRTHQVGYRNGNAGPRIDFEVTPEWNHYIIKFETTDVATSGRVVFWDSVDGLVLAYPKLEKGNKATGWTPAPEDTAEAITHVESELTQKHDSITATVSSLDGRVAQQKVTLDSIVSTISDIEEDAEGTTELLNQTVSTVNSQSSALATIRTDLDGKATITQFNTITSTVNGTIQRVGNAEGKITQIENNVDGLQTTVANKASQSQFTQLATGLSSVVTELDNLEVGGRNLFVNTTTWGRPWDLGHYTEVEDPLGENNAVILNSNNQFLGYVVPRANMSKFEPGNYVLSFWAKGDSNRTHSVGYRNGAISPRIDFDVTPEWNHYVMKFTTTDKTTTGRVVFWDSVDGLALAYPKLEKGTTATDWTPAPEDTNDKFDHIETEWTQTFDTFSQTVTGIDGRVTEQKQTIEGLETTIQDTQSDLSGTTTLLNQTKETVDSRTSVLAELRTDVDGKTTISQFNTLSSTVDGTVARVGNAEGKITQIETSVNGLQSTVADKASQSQVTQLANGLSSVVRDVSNIPIWTKVLPKASQDNPVELTDLDGNSLSTNSSYEIYLSAESGTSVDNYSIYAYNNGGFKLIGRSGSGVDASLFRNNNRVWVETNFSNPAQSYAYTVTVTELASQGGRSSISQLSDNINLRVEKGDVLSQINIESDRTLIQSDRLLLDADNVVFSGKAWIPSSVIGNLEADKITSGTLDAGKITVTNLDANSITSNKASFVSAGFNAINSNLTINGSSLTYSHTDGSQTIMNANGLYHRRGGMDYETHFLRDVINVSGLNHASTGKWVTLPSIYKGKNFTAHAVVADTYGVTNDYDYYNLAMLRVVCFVDEIDKAGGRVKVRGYSFHRDIRNNNTMRKAIQAKVIVQY